MFLTKQTKDFVFLPSYIFFSFLSVSPVVAIMILTSPLYGNANETTTWQRIILTKIWNHHFISLLSSHCQSNPDILLFNAYLHDGVGLLSQVAIYYIAEYPTTTVKWRKEKKSHQKSTAWRCTRGHGAKRKGND